MEQLIGQSIGDTSKAQPNRYRITALLGKQTGRRTFLAEDLRTNSPVVVKLVLFGPDFVWEDLKLFEREAQTLKSLKHPAIPKYIDSFEVKTLLGQGFALVQTYIEARSLQSWVKDGHSFSEDESKAIAHSLLNILKYLHRRQPPIIHRDIKPSNILLTTPDKKESGTIYLIDFGAVQTACPNGTITVVGTYGYMPPEQFGGRAGPASDLYSVGATLIYLSTGKHPAELTQSNLQIDFDDAHLSPSFSNLLRRLTYADLNRRIRSATQALNQLAQLDRKSAGREGAKTAASADKSSKILKSTYGDLAVGTDPQKLVIQLLESRTNILEEYFRVVGPLTRSNIHKTEPQMSLGTISVVCLFIIVFLAPEFLPKYAMEKPLIDLYILLGGALVSATVFVVSTILWPKRIGPKCRLTLSKEHSDIVRLSLARIASKKDTGWLQSEHQRDEFLLWSNIELQSISISPGIFRDAIKFTIANEKSKNPRKFNIHGSHQEIDWICEHIRRWGQVKLTNR